MVYVNSKKYACESCIKGHRSSSCHHNDRPLYEIKKKGRPVSQCDKCREARQSRRIHAKCTCESEGNSNTSVANGEGRKKQGKRFIPTIPSLPNGLKDALKASSSSSAGVNVPKQPVDALLNPCHCEDVYNCKCRQRVNDSGVRLEHRPSKPVDPAIFSNGLSALALVASCCSPATPPVPPQLHKQVHQALSSEKVGSRIHADLDKKSEARLSGISKRKRSPRSSPVPQSDVSDVNTPKSKPFRSIASASSGMENLYWTTSVPSYSHAVTLPPIVSSSSARTHTAATDPRTTDGEDTSHCCCGTRCECAGCKLHGAAPTSQASWVDEPAEAGTSVSPAPMHGHGAHCSEECPTCVDHDGGIELPPIGSIPGVPANSPAAVPPYLADFYARAASLPAPPAHRRSSMDPTNVTVYPPGLFRRRREDSDNSKRTERDDDPARAFGLVRIPKLEECCGGRCGCAEEACGCGDKCDGCCMDDGHVDEGGNFKDKPEEAGVTTSSRLSPSISFARGRGSVDFTQPPTSPRVPSSTASEMTRSCCVSP